MTEDDEIKNSMNLLTSFVNSVVKQLVSEKMRKYFIDVKIYWVKNTNNLILENENKICIEQPEIMESYFELSDVKNSDKLLYNGIEIWNKFPETLLSLRDIYFFIIYTVFMRDERLFKGYIKNLPNDYFTSGNFCEILNIDLLMNMYVKHYLLKLELPQNNLFTALSAEQYEKNESQALITFVKSDDEIYVQYRFEKEYEFSESNLRTIRKLMETTKESGLSLIASRRNDDTWCLVGLSKIANIEYTIKFEGELSWLLLEGKKEIFKFYKGRYILNTGENIKEYKTQIYNKVNEEYQEIVISITDILVKQTHGTAAVVSKNSCIAKEAQRLCDKNKGIKMSGFDFLCKKDKDEECKTQIGMTNIDGALLIDDKGICHAIGVIVDGETTIDGDTGRGARYNSIKNYVNWLNKCKYKGSYFIGIIVSEDGMVNIVVPK